MKVLIRLVNNQLSTLLDQTQFPTQNLTKQTMQQFLFNTYNLSSGYEITYVDPDGDEIMVEFDDDYQVARITHQQEEHALILTVKILNQQWLSQFGNQNNQNDTCINNYGSLVEQKQVTHNKERQVIISQPQLIKTEKQQNYIQLLQQKQPTTLTNNVQTLNAMIPIQGLNTHSDKVESQQVMLLPQLIQKEEEQQTKQPEIIKEIKEINQIKPNKIQPLKKKTQTQSDKSSDSEDNNQQENQLLLPLVATKTQQNNNLIDLDLLTPLHQIQISSIQHKPKKQSKKPKKEKKQSLPQALDKLQKQKKKLTYTQKQIKKLIKKQVQKLIPQIASQIKKENQQQNQYGVIKILSTNLQKIISLNCSHCQQKLTVPFYINSSEGLKLCENCQNQDLSVVTLIKIKDPSLIEKLIWAEPLCQVAKTQEQDPVKFYTEMKKSLQTELKGKMNKRIKQAKKVAKDEKDQQIIKKKDEKQCQLQKQNLQNPVDSSSSSV